MNIRQTIKCFLVSLTVVFLYFAGQIRLLTTDEARRAVLWTRNQGVILIAEMLVLAIVLTTLACVVRWLSRRRQALWMDMLLGHIFLVVLLGGLMAAAPMSLRLDIRPNVTALMWILGVGAIGFSLGRRQSGLVRYAGNLCLILSPTVAIVAAQLLTWPSWGECPTGSFEPRIQQQEKTPVFFLIFDEWSYLRSTDPEHHQRFLPFFKNVRNLSDRSVTFTQAISPWGCTELSVPALIYQKHAMFGYRDGCVYIHGDRSEAPSRSIPSLFQVARDRGYNGYMIGWHNPYHALLGEQVDHYPARAMGNRGNTIFHAAVSATIRNLQYWHDPLTRTFRSRYSDSIQTKASKQQDDRIHSEISRLMTVGPFNTFAVCHYRLIHNPFNWNEDGTYRRLDWRDVGPSSEAGYLRSLRYLDRYIGDVLATLRAGGQYDESLLIITADHGWRMDADVSIQEEAHWERRVPLIIKLPRQMSGEVIDKEFRADELMPFFEAVFSGERRTAHLMRLLTETVDSYVPEG